MAKAKKIKEIVAITPNKPGMLARVTNAISKAGVNILAINAHTAGNKAKFYIVTQNNEKAMKALQREKFGIKENNAVSVQLANRIGSAGRLAQKLAKAGVDLDYCYGSTGDGSSALFVFSTKDINKAFKLCG